MFENIFKYIRRAEKGDVFDLSDIYPPTRAEEYSRVVKQHGYEVTQTAVGEKRAIIVSTQGRVPADLIHKISAAKDQIPKHLLRDGCMYVAKRFISSGLASGALYAEGHLRSAVDSHVLPYVQGKQITAFDVTVNHPFYGTVGKPVTCFLIQARSPEDLLVLMDTFYGSEWRSLTAQQIDSIQEHEYGFIQHAVRKE